MHIGINAIHASLLAILPERPLEPAARQSRLHAWNVLIGILRQPERIILCPYWGSAACFGEVILQEILTGINDRLSAECRFNEIKPGLCARDDLIVPLTVIRLKVQNWRKFPIIIHGFYIINVTGCLLFGIDIRAEEVISPSQESGRF